MPFEELVENTIWIRKYPVHYAGSNLHARMTIVRLLSGDLLLHSPCEIDAVLKAAIGQLGRVAYIVAPGTYHYLHMPSAQEAFPDATTLICPGVEQKLPSLGFDWLLGDRPLPELQDDFAQVLVRGNRMMWEVAFYHKPSQTLLLVDLIENIGDLTPDTDLVIKIWWKVLFHMWNHPKPAPEYQMGWKDRQAARASLLRILDWDFQRIILAHGDLILSDAHAVARKAWEKPLATGRRA